MRLVEEILLISRQISLKYMTTKRQIHTHQSTHSHCLILPTKPALWVEPMPGYVPYQNNWFCCTSKQHCFWELAFINLQNSPLAIYPIFCLTQYFSVSYLCCGCFNGVWYYGLSIMATDSQQSAWPAMLRNSKKSQERNHYYV